MIDKIKHIYDISMPLSENIPVWPTSEKFNITWLKNLTKHGVNESKLSLNSHSGTHIDVPFHFFSEGQKIGDISLNRLIGKTIIVEYDRKGDIHSDFLDKIDIPRDCNKILFKTSNSALLEEPFNENYISLSEEGAKWIAEKDIDLVGIDYISIQPFCDKENRTHKILLENNVLILEGLNLNHVEEGIYTLIALPLNILEAEAAPVRAVLFREEQS